MAEWACRGLIVRLPIHASYGPLSLHPKEKNTMDQRMDGRIERKDVELGNAALSCVAGAGVGDTGAVADNDDADSVPEEVGCLKGLTIHYDFQGDDKEDDVRNSEILDSSVAADEAGVDCMSCERSKNAVVV
ncbi:hypothetical protein BGX28_005292 [Mortierella sp. GBA30]|nr:hypothetical protein BGX28_005292 [Mortierella sp. GBA30]